MKNHSVHQSKEHLLYNNLHIVFRRNEATRVVFLEFFQNQSILALLQNGLYYFLSRCETSSSYLLDNSP